MNMNEYQEAAVSTAIYGRGNKVIYPTLGLCGEAGEVAEKIKKILRDKDGDFSQHTEDIKKELGDVMWYIANMANDLNITMEEIAQTNISKLLSRKERNMIHGSGDNR